MCLRCSSISSSHSLRTNSSSQAGSVLSARHTETWFSGYVPDVSSSSADMVVKLRCRLGDGPETQSLSVSSCGPLSVARCLFFGLRLLEADIFARKSSGFATSSSTHSTPRSLVFTRRRYRDTPGLLKKPARDGNRAQANLA
jgi:hypothetical protein